MNLLNLLISNKTAPRNFSIKQQDNGEPVVYIYDVIGDDYYGGISAKEFAQEVAALDGAPAIHFRISCPGGDVFAARAMVSAVRPLKSKTIAHIDSYAASAATFFAVNCDEVVIAEGGFFMIHNGWTLAMGDANELLKTVDLLRMVDTSIAADYVKKTGRDEQTIRDWMDAETWFTADEAVANGFCDSIESVTAVKNQWNLSAYKNAPKNLIESVETDKKIDEKINMHRQWLTNNLSLLERIA